MKPIPSLLLSLLNQVFDYLGSKRADKKFLELIWGAFITSQPPDEIISVFSRQGIYNLINQKIDDITQRKFQIISPFLAGNKILDIGAGNGILDELINRESEKEITLLDVVDFNKSNLPIKIYDGVTIPFPDLSFDISLLIVTLHHSNSPEEILSEVVRVTKNRIIIIETVYDTQEEKEINSFFDWFANLILLRRDISITFNYRTVSEWSRLFKTHQLKQIESRDLGWKHQPISPEHRYLFVLEKS